MQVHPIASPRPRQLPTAPARADAHQIRLQQTVDAAEVRATIGVAALHKRAADGAHLIIFAGRVFRGKTLEGAIKAAERG